MKLISAALAACLITLPVSAKDKAGPERSRAFQDLVNCRSLTESTARLACYDRTAASLDVAEKAKTIVIVDQEQIKEARRSVFGLTLPNITLFGPASGDQLDRIETTIASVQQSDSGPVTLTLADGAVWVQSDDFFLAGRIAPGTKVTIKRGFASSFFATVEGRPGFRVRRVTR